LPSLRVEDRVVSEDARCVEVCAACADACERAARFCLERGGGYADRGRVATLIQCAAFTGTLSEHFRDNPTDLGESLDAFAEICRRSAALCAEFDDEPLVECARHCLACASCAERAGVTLASG
jgi:hypothetical protein